MSGRVLVRLGVGNKKIGLAKKKLSLKKFKSLSEVTKKLYHGYATFVSSDKLLKF